MSDLVRVAKEKYDSNVALLTQEGCEERRNRVCEEVEVRGRTRRLTTKEHEEREAEGGALSAALQA